MINKQMLNRIIFISNFSVFLMLFLTSCDSDHRQDYEPSYSAASKLQRPIYLFGIHPLHNPSRLHAVFSPIMQYLSEKVDNAEFRLEASRNYSSYEKKLYAGKFHFSLPNPYQTVKALKYNYRVFGKMGDDENFRGIILMRKDSGITKVTELKGKAVSFPAPTALAATMLPQYYLQQHGLDVMKDIDIRYVGSQESSIINVFVGDTVAGATWPPPWRALQKERPELANEMSVIWETQNLPNNGLVARYDMPQKLVDQVLEVLVNLHTHDHGRKMLARMELSRFEPAENSTYQPVLDFLEKFDQQVRPIE